MFEKDVCKSLVQVPRPAGPLEAALLPALHWGLYTFEGFFDSDGRYYERITRRGRRALEAWFCLEPWPAAGRMESAA